MPKSHEVKCVPTFVRSRPIDRESRVACALHFTLERHSKSLPLWLMVPISEENLEKIHGVAVFTEDGIITLNVTDYSPDL